MGFLDFGSDPSPSKMDLKRIEAKLDLILNHLGLKFEWPVVSDEVRRLAKDGEKIQAIKVHREETGDSLADAKQIVELVARR